jgi:hypothetical protein
VIFAEIAFKTHIVFLDLCWEHFVICVSQCLLLRLTFLLIVSEILHRTFKLGLEHINCLDRLSSYILGKFWGKLPQIVKVHIKAGPLLSDQGLNSFLLLSFAHILSGS